MDTVTYPDKRVIDYFDRFLAAVQIPVSSQPLPQQFNVGWTPTLIILDPEGAEHHRTVGYLPPEELIPSLILGMAKSYFDHTEFDKAVTLFDRISSEYPGSDMAAEAIYFRGVSRFKLSHDLKHMKEAYENLKVNYGESQWTRRASVYEQVK